MTSRSNLTLALLALFGNNNANERCDAAKSIGASTRRGVDFEPSNHQHRFAEQDDGRYSGHGQRYGALSSTRDEVRFQQGNQQSQDDARDGPARVERSLQQGGGLHHGSAHEGGDRERG